MVNRELIKINIEKYNPLSEEYINYWKSLKRKCIEGLWIGNDYIPAPIFFYRNFWNIKLNKANSKSKSLGNPHVRDLEWERAWIYMEARGFSGFINDDEYHCDYKILFNQTEDPNYIDKRKFLNPEEYLKRNYTKPLGKPLYKNEAKNVLDLEARDTGKSYWVAMLSAMNFLFDGALDYDEYLQALSINKPMSSETMIGAIDAFYSGQTCNKLVLGLDNLEGSMTFQDKFYPSPLWKYYDGSLQPSKFIIAKKDVKIKNNWITKGSKSIVHHRTFYDNELAGNGTRPSFTVLDEVGFMDNLTLALGHLKDCTCDSGVKFGTIWLCVCAGTKIWTANGNLINIEDLNKKDGIIGWDENTKNVSPTYIENMFPPSIKECFRITTNMGRILECSYDHPILWSKENFGSKPRIKGSRTKRDFIKKTTFKETKDIKVDDQIAIADTVDIFTNKTMWEPRLVGMLIGDGCYAFNKTPILSNCDLGINNYIDERYDVKVEKSYITKDGRLYRESRIRGICNNLRELGIYGQTKLKKTLPLNIHSYSKETICELIAGLYDTDGCVCIVKNTLKASVTLSSMSRNLMEEVRLLLQKLGIHGIISECLPNPKNKLDKNSYYKLSIGDKRSLLNFANNINLLVNYKQENLNRIKEIYKDKPFRKSKSIEGIRFERVVKIENIGNQVVYNLTAGVHNTYLANGIITHNTGTGGDSRGKGTEEIKRVFHNPEDYDCVTREDIYENKGRKCFFIPKFLAYNDDYRDSNGFTLIDKALKKWEADYTKAKGSNDDETLNSFLQNSPAKPSHALLSLDGNNYPTVQISEHLGEIETLKVNKALLGTIGNLEFRNDDSLEFIPNDKLKPVDYPVNKYHKKGGIIIYEEPTEDKPKGKYIAGCDPIGGEGPKQDIQSDSVFSIIIYKRCTENDLDGDKIVAEYTGREDTFNDTFEHARKLLLYYNAFCLYENNCPNFKSYLENKNQLYLLCKTPKSLSNIAVGKETSTYGIRMTKQIAEISSGYAKDKLLGKAPNGKFNLQNIYSIGLLKEFLASSEGVNTDREVAYKLVCILLLQLERVKVEETKKQSYDSFFFNKEGERRRFFV